MKIFVKNQRNQIRGNKILQNSTQIPAVDVVSCDHSHKSKHEQNPR